MIKDYFDVNIHNLPLINYDKKVPDKSAIYINNLRTELFRCWDQKKPMVNVVMNYPSTADSKKEDVTTTRLNNILANQGIGGYRLYNIAEENWLSNHNLDVEVPLIIAWGSKIRKQKRTKKIRDKLKKFKYLLQFDSPKNYSECMPTRLSNNTRLIKIKY